METTFAKALEEGIVNGYGKGCVYVYVYVCVYENGNEGHSGQAVEATGCRLGADVRQ